MTIKGKIIFDTQVLLYAMSSKHKQKNPKLSQEASGVLESLKDQLIIPPFVAFELLKCVTATDEEIKFYEDLARKYPVPTFNTIMASMAATIRRKLYQQKNHIKGEKPDTPDYTMDLFILSYAIVNGIPNILSNDNFFSNCKPVLQDLNLLDKISVFKLDSPEIKLAQPLLPF